MSNTKPQSHLPMNTIAKTAVIGTDSGPITVSLIFAEQKVSDEETLVALDKALTKVINDMPLMIRQAVMDSIEQKTVDLEASPVATEEKAYALSLLGLNQDREKVKQSKPVEEDKVPFPNCKVAEAYAKDPMHTVTFYPVNGTEYSIDYDRNILYTVIAENFARKERLANQPLDDAMWTEVLLELLRQAKWKFSGAIETTWLAHNAVTEDTIIAAHYQCASAKLNLLKTADEKASDTDVRYYVEVLRYLIDEMLVEKHYYGVDDGIIDSNESTGVVFLYVPYDGIPGTYIQNQIDYKVTQLK